VIPDVRRSLAEAVDELGVAVFPTLPDDVADLPCVVVGRPALSPSETDLPTLAIRTPVYVVGSRVIHEDSQDELDQLTSDVLAAFGLNRYEVDLGSLLIGGRIESASPTMLTIAGQDYPGYIVTIVGELKC
jgi:hypothetical protein